MDLVLRKRICFNVYKRHSITDKIRRRMGHTSSLTSLALQYEIVSNIPKVVNEQQIGCQLSHILQSSSFWGDSKLDDVELWILRLDQDKADGNALESLKKCIIWWLFVGKVSEIGFRMQQDWDSFLFHKLSRIDLESKVDSSPSFSTFLPSYSCQERCPQEIGKISGMIPNFLNLTVPWEFLAAPNQERWKLYLPCRLHYYYTNFCATIPLLLPSFY